MQAHGYSELIKSYSDVEQNEVLNVLIIQCLCGVYDIQIKHDIT